MADAPPPTDRERELEEKVRRLEAENAAQKKRLAELDEQKKRLAEVEQENKELKNQLARALTTSRNSSKRPSSDIVKPRPAPAASGRKIGAQPGHPQHERAPFVPADLDAVLCYEMHACPDCGGPLKEDTGVLPSVVQQVEITARPVEITEH